MQFPPSPSFDCPALDDLSLNHFDALEGCWPSQFPFVQNEDYSVSSQSYLSSSGQFHSKWSVPALESSLNSSLHMSFMLPKDEPAIVNGPCIPYFPFPELDVPPSPTDTCSSFSTDSAPPTSPSPPPESIHVVCKVPVIAPVPLPYHSPTFLQFDLPDVEEDLSHPPYTQRLRSASKRKRDNEDTLVHERLTQRRRLGDVPQISGYSARRQPTSGRPIRRLVQR
jgi:hypothetical protein